jgi:CubicO group peptidase (beta-lactamase class C family)
MIRIFYLFIICSLIWNCERNSSGIEFGDTYQWPVSTPEKQGLTGSRLASALSAADHTGFMDGILIIKNGYLVAEQYFNGFDAIAPHNVMSVSKSFLSAATGIALENGYIDSLNQKVLPFFPEYNRDDLDPRKQEITIRNLLMMQAGYESEYYNFMAIYSSENWIKTTIEWPLKYDPGTTFSYNTFETHLLSAILTKATGQSTLTFVTKNLLEPIGIEVHYWEQDPQGYYFGGTNMFFTPREMAVLGYLYLNDGKLNGQQIVPEHWVTESITNYTLFEGKNWGDLHNYNYGYLWWLGEINGNKAFIALGYGGQYIISFPDLDMIIVTTSENNLDWDTADAHEQTVVHLVAEYIL